MPPLMDVRSANERGSSMSWSPNLRAASAPSITVQSITTRCELTPDHSTKDRKSTRLNSSHGSISYAVFCLKKKNHSTRLRLTRPPHQQPHHGPHNDHEP